MQLFPGHALSIFTGSFLNCAELHPYGIYGILYGIEVRAIKTIGLMAILVAALAFTTISYAAGNIPAAGSLLPSQVGHTAAGVTEAKQSVPDGEKARTPESGVLPMGQITLEPSEQNKVSGGGADAAGQTVQVLSDLNAAAMSSGAQPVRDMPPIISAPSSAAGAAAAQRAQHPTVLIDPGHGGTDTGAIGVGGAREKDYTLDIALQIKAKLEMNGVNVVMSRADDRTISLGSRTDLANASSIDAFISVHINAAPNTGATGIETYYREGDPASKALAANIHGSVLRRLGVADRKLKNGNWLWVVKKTTAPAVLVEYLFITTAADARILQQEQKRQDMADATADGILRYLAGEVWNASDSPPVPGLPLPLPPVPAPLISMPPAAGL
jgi:N-acetylmuramoyl-L-alanine amidase